MQRSVTIAYGLAALFAIIAIVDLAVRPMHYERTLALAVVLAIGAAVVGWRRSQAA